MLSDVNGCFRRIQIPKKTMRRNARHMKMETPQEKVERIKQAQASRMTTEERNRVLEERNIMVKIEKLVQDVERKHPETAQDKVTRLKGYTKEQEMTDEEQEMAKHLPQTRLP